MGHTALVVDDDEDIRMLLRAVLETSHIVVVGEAADGDRALDLADELEPDAIVIDQMMPGMNGIDTAALLRERHPNMPIILFSAHLDPRVERRAIAAGVSRCVGKHEIASIPSLVEQALARAARPSP